VERASTEEAAHGSRGSPSRANRQSQSQVAVSGPEPKEPSQEQASMDQAQKPKAMESTPTPYASRSSGSLTPFQVSSRLLDSLFVLWH